MDCPPFYEIEIINALFHDSSSSSSEFSLPKNSKAFKEFHYWNPIRNTHALKLGVEEIASLFSSSLIPWLIFQFL